MTGRGDACSVAPTNLLRAAVTRVNANDPASRGAVTSDDFGHARALPRRTSGARVRPKRLSSFWFRASTRERVVTHQSAWQPTCRLT
jgi:hypothetical protein